MSVPSISNQIESYNSSTNPQDALASVINHLEKGDLHLALKVANEIPSNSYYKVSAFMLIAEALIEKDLAYEASQLFKDAIEMTQTLPDGAKKACALGSIVEALPVANKRMVAAGRVEEAIELTKTLFKITQVMMFGNASDFATSCIAKVLPQIIKTIVVDSKYSQQAQEIIALPYFHALSMTEGAYKASIYRNIATAYGYAGKPEMEVMINRAANSMSTASGDQKQ